MPTKTVKPTSVGFDKIHADYLARGIDLYDVNGLGAKSDGGGHFEKWHKAKGLPDHDEQGKHFRSSKIFFSQYRQDENGKVTAPLYVNVWHYLIKLSKPIKWKTSRSEHRKILPLSEPIMSIPDEITEEQIEKFRKLFGGFDGMDDAMIDSQIKGLLDTRLQAIESRKVLLDIINEYGIDDEQYGKLLLLEMKVGR